MIRKRKEKGFTVMELVIVAVIISIGAAIAVPRFNGVITKLRFKSTGRNIVSTLRLARANAISKRAQFGVYFDVNNQQYIFYKDIQNLDSYTFDVGDSVITTETLAPNLNFGYSAFNNDAVVFLSDGSASTSGYVDLYLSESSDYLMVDVLASTGRVKLIKYSYGDYY
jgi:prepilin-type N-terminal cleavage/methylation domain-containing protein